MYIVPNLQKDNLSKEQIEYLQKQQMEYKLLGRKRKIPGHSLFSYNTMSGEIKPAEVINKVSIGLDGNPITKSETVIEENCYYEQALNIKSFRKRLKRNGIINE